MPLIKSGSKGAFKTNVREMIHSGYPQKQALAASYSNQRKYNKAEGGAALKLALSTARKYAGGGYARKADGGDDLEEQKQQAIGIHPVNPDAPPAPTPAPKAPPPPPMSEADLTKAYLKNLTGTETGQAGTPFKKVTSGMAQGLVDMVKEPGKLMEGPTQVQPETPGEWSDLDEQKQQWANDAYAKEMTDFGAGTATGMIGMARMPGMPKAPPGAITVGGGTPPGGKYFGKYWHPYELDPEEVKGAKKTSGQAGSNPGGVYELANGEPVYIKQFEGPNAIERTYNEVLANKLLELTGVPTAKVEMTQLKGKPAVASYIVPGDQLNAFGTHEYDSLKGLREHYPAHLWTGNYDFVGNGWDNIMVMPNKQTVHIDPGGALRYRAQGDLKGPDMWGPNVQHFDLDKNFAAGSVLKGHLNDPEMQASAQRVANVTDQQIHDLVQKYGPINKTEKPKLEATLKARRDGVAKLYGVGKESEPAWPSLEQEIAELLAAKKAPVQSASPLDLEAEIAALAKQIEQEKKPAAASPASPSWPTDDAAWAQFNEWHEKLAQQPLNLTPLQQGAVSHWTDPAGYKELQGYLRGANNSTKAQALIPHLDSAMTPLQQDTIGWRGIHGPQADQLTGLKMGDKFYTAGYSSTTIDPRRATHYGMKSDPGIILNYHLPAGSEALYTSHPNSGAWSTAERELLIPHGQPFEITGIEHIKAPVWDYTGKLKDKNPHDFTVYHVAPVADEAGATQLDAIGAQPAKPPPAAPANPVSLTGMAKYDPQKDAYVWHGMTLSSPLQQAQNTIKLPGTLPDKFAQLEQSYGKEYSNAVVAAVNDILGTNLKAPSSHHEPIDYAMDNDRAPPDLTSEDFGGIGQDPWANHSLKFFEKDPWFAKNTQDQIKGMGTTPGLIEQIKKAVSGKESAVRVLNNKQWQDYRPPTNEHPKPIDTPNAETDPEKMGFNRFVEFHHNTPNKGKSGYLEQLVDPEKKNNAPGVSYGDEHALYALDKPFTGYGAPTGPYLGRFNKVLELYFPNAKGETFANTGNNGEQAAPGVQKRIIAAAKDQGVDLVILHGMNDVGPANQTQYLIIDTKATLRAKDAKFNEKLLDKNSTDPLASHTLSGIAGASVVGAGLLGAQKEGDEKKMAKGGKVSPNAVLEVKRFKAGKIMIGAKEKAHRTVKKYAKGGKTPFEPKDHDFINFKKGGMIDSDIPGRSDYIPMKVSTGAYVLPADIPSALGQGNSKAGKVILDKMFTAGPYGLPLGKKGGKGTSGTKMSKMGFKDGGKIKAEKALPEDHQLGMAVPKGGSMCANCKYLASPTTCGNDGFVKWNGSENLPNPANSYCCDLYDIRAMKKADGGPTEQNGNDDHVPIIAAGGEYILSPEVVKHLGNGNMDHGHQVLDKFVLHTRKEHIKTLKGLKPPK